MKTLLRDCSLSAVVAGFIATVISYAGPLVIIFQAAKAGGLSQDILSSWVWTISIGSGVLGILLSLRYKVPIIIAWSAPGSALLVTMLPDITLNEAVGAYVVTSVVVLLVGLSGAFDRIINRLPAAIAAGMLAGILFRFGTGLFISIKEQPWLVLAMFATYLAFKRALPRYAVLVVGVTITVASGIAKRGLGDRLGDADLDCPRVQLAGDAEYRLSAGDGGADRAIRSGHGCSAQRRLQHAGQPVDQQQRIGFVAAGALRLPRTEPCCNHSGDLHGPGSTRESGEALRCGRFGRCLLSAARGIRRDAGLHLHRVSPGSDRSPGRSGTTGRNWRRAECRDGNARRP